MNRECGLRKEEQDKSDDWRALGEKLSEVWKKLNPDIESVTVEMLNQDRDDLEKREASIDDMEVKEVLAEFGFDINGLELDKQIELSGKPEALYRLKVKNHFWDKHCNFQNIREFQNDTLIDIPSHHRYSFEAHIPPTLLDEYRIL